MSDTSLSLQQSQEASSGRAPHTWRDELEDLMRGLGGAAIIGIPLIYTMEMWHLATTLAPSTVFLLVVAALVINIGYNFASGFRRGGGLRDAVFDSVESLGLGALFALVLLVLLRIVDRGTPMIDVACKTALEAIPLSIGISVANTQFAGSRTGGEGGSEGSESVKDEQRRHPTIVEIGVTIAGAIIFSFNVAPTEEIILLATQTTWGHLIALILFSLALSYGMIFIAEFAGVEERRSTPGFLQSPINETLIAYLLSLLVALGMLYAFHSVTFEESPYTMVAAMVVLGLPATIGGAAGRLVV